MTTNIEIGKSYKIALTHPLFADWIGVLAECKRKVNGLFEMHANGAYIYCQENQLRRKYEKRAKFVEIAKAQNEWERKNLANTI